MYFENKNKQLRNQNVAKVNAVEVGGDDVEVDEKEHENGDRHDENDEEKGAEEADEEEVDEEEEAAEQEVPVEPEPISGRKRRGRPLSSKIMEEDRSFICQFCGLGFAKQKTLTGHYASHKDIRPARSVEVGGIEIGICEVCGDKMNKKNGFSCVRKCKVKNEMH